MHLQREHSRVIIWERRRSRWAFYNGAGIGNQDIVELYCEHPAITSAEYAYRLFESWNDGKPNQVFQFLLGKLIKET